MNIQNIKLVSMLLFIFLLLSFNMVLAKDTLYISNYIIRNSCAENNIKDIENFINTDGTLDGEYYSLIRTKDSDYSLRIIFKNNYFDSIDLYDNSKSIGFTGVERKHVLNISCHDLYQENSKCYKDRIFIKNINQNKRLRELCVNELNNRLIPKSNYFDDIVGKYLFAIGFNPSFINDIFKYKDKINHGILDY
ncbi:hypothetical protein PT286_03505 [Neisseriaceae bacterium ESL0693]|nr:hypothetical protein [Neisseriaceae bacterium ESL0693]